MTTDHVLDELFDEDLSSDQRIARARLYAKVIDEQNIRVKLSLKVSHYCSLIAALTVALNSPDLTPESKREVVGTMDELEEQLMRNFPGRRQ